MSEPALPERLSASERRLQLALSAGRGIGTWDWHVPSDRVFADERFAQLYGVDAELARAGAAIAEFFRSIHPDDVPALKERIDRALHSGDLFSEEYRLVQPDGSVRWVLAEGRCDLDADGVPQHFQGASFDISKRKVAEQTLLDLNAELERRVIEQSQARGRTWQ